MNLKEIDTLGLIAALMSKGYSPLERRKDGKRVFFIFETDEEFDRLCDDYYNSRLDVDAQLFTATLKSVKASIYKMK